MRTRWLAAGAFALGALWGACLRADDAAPVEEAATRLDPAWLEGIRHETPLRHEEARGYYAILEHVRAVPPALLRQAAQEFEAERRAAHQADPARRRLKYQLFVDLFQHPEEFVGEPVFLTGHVRRAVSFAADPHDGEIAELYELWLYAPDSQSNPAVVVCSELSEGFPLGDSILEEIEVTGYFFKMYAYEARQGFRKAPMLLARSVTLKPRPARPPATNWGAYVLLAGGAAVGVWMLLWFMRRGGARRSAPPPPDELSRLA